mmetsp:Transcript_3155/g.19450  ORF Transcript_3155/g.19450 Transcript_3155/m.19450 type:complete len:264 (-) Transcript_3155:2114-2905(-)
MQDVATELHLLHLVVVLVEHQQLERQSQVEVPSFGRTHAMQVRRISLRQQEQDGGGTVPGPVVSFRQRFFHHLPRVAIRLHVKSAFWMRLHVQTTHKLLHRRHGVRRRRDVHPRCDSSTSSPHNDVRICRLQRVASATWSCESCGSGARSAHARVPASCADAWRTCCCETAPRRRRWRGCWPSCRSRRHVRAQHVLRRRADGRRGGKRRSWMRLSSSQGSDAQLWWVRRPRWRRWTCDTSSQTPNRCAGMESCWPWCTRGSAW